MQGALLSQLYTSLDMVVLERLSAGVFRLTTPEPLWLQALGPALAPGDTAVCLGERFPFLENFLVDAERFWLANSPGQLRSGPWREVTSAGQEYYLEAVVVSLKDSKILLLTFPSMAYEEKQMLIQKARNNSLAYHRFQKELQQKDVLLHCIVHDLTSPLNSIILGLALLETEKLTGDGKSAVEICLSQTRRQKALIQDMLAVFAVESGSPAGVASPSAGAVDLLDGIQSVMEAMQPSCLQHRVALTLAPEVDHTAHWQVVGEASCLERVIFNLIENALRHSPEGAAVTLSLVAQGHSVLTTVDDLGPGVPPHLVATMFDKFTQGSTTAGKVGLGLYFCHIMIEGWGGRIGYLPQPGGGARFWFTLPRSAPDEVLNAAVER